jgi:hypothetical protein
MRKTSNDYRKELDNARKKIDSLESRIKDKLIKMIEKFPDAIVVEKGIDKFKAKYVTKTWIDGLTTDTMIDYIQAIEEHNANTEPYVQTTIYD